MLGLACDAIFWYCKKYRRASLFGARTWIQGVICVISLAMLVVSFIEICGGHVSAAGGANLAFDALGFVLGLIDRLDLRKKGAQAEAAGLSTRYPLQESSPGAGGITRSVTLQPPPTIRNRSH